MNLDAGPITIEEMAQGGLRGAEEYWNLTKDRTLVTSITGHPDVLKKWQGKILFYNVIAPDPAYVNAMREITDFNLCFSVGGNTLGACLYMAKGILGANPIAYIGADFCFGYNKKFHPWESPYDKQYSGLVPWVDIFGNSIRTWPSYLNFKHWFDYIAEGGKGNQPGMYVNCTEGGILGSYPQGNIRSIKQLGLAEFLWPYNLHKQLPEQLKDPKQYKFLF